MIFSNKLIYSGQELSSCLYITYCAPRKKPTHSDEFKKARNWYFNVEPEFRIILNDNK